MPIAIRAFLILTLVATAPLAGQDETRTPGERLLALPAARSLALLPDGRSVAWVETSPEGSVIRLLLPEGDEAEALALTGADETLTLLGPLTSERLLALRDGEPDGEGVRRAAVALGRDDRGLDEISELPLPEGVEARPSRRGVLVIDGASLSVWEPSKGTVRSLHEGGGRIAAAVPSPDGFAIAIVEEREIDGERWSALLVLHLGIDSISPAALHPGAITAPVWSADGRRLAFLRSLGSPPRSFDGAAGAPADDPWDVALAEVEPKGWTLDGSGGRAPTPRSALRAPEPRGFGRARLEWIDGERLALVSERDGWARLWTVTLANPDDDEDRPSQLKPISPAFSEVFEFAVARDGRLAWISNADLPEQRRVWVESPEGPARPLTPVGSFAFELRALEDGRLACLVADGGRPAGLRVLDPASGTVLERRAEEATEETLAPPTPVELSAADGTPLRGLLHVPEGPRRRGPAVLMVGDGFASAPAIALHPDAMLADRRALAQELVARGFLVLELAGRGVSGRGRALRTAARRGAGGAAEHLDVRAALRWLRAREDVDPERIGVQGGWLAALTLARDSDLVAGGVARGAISDWQRWLRWRGAEALDEEAAARAQRSSPLAWVDGWTAPTLLIHGDDDRSVPVAESLRLARALEDRGVPHELLLVAGEDREFRHFASRRRALLRSADFLVRHVSEKGSPGAALPTGPARREIELFGTRIEVFTHKPANYDGERMILVLHGTLRNADEYRDHAVAMGERFGALIVAPRFDRARFPNRRYHRGGILDAEGRAAPPEAWTYRMIPALAAAVRGMESRPGLRHWIIGHSAGGQFVARMSAFQETGAVRQVAANPGSQLFPTRELPFGYGFGELPASLASDEALKRYLAAPLTLYLGTLDNAPDDYFDTSPSAMVQGPGRLQRGRAAFDRGRALALERGWAFNWRIVEAEGVGHDHEKMFDHPSCASALFD